LVQELLALDQVVVGLDNFTNGHRHNLADVQARVTSGQWSRFIFMVYSAIPEPGTTAAIFG
jgi:UDP-N-acetylglucosamine 4-epimerase